VGGKSEELRELIANIPGGSLAAKVRQLMPVIDRRIREEGVRHEQIVAVLNEHGGLEKPLTLNHFRWILADFRKRRRRAAAEALSPGDSPALASPLPSLGAPRTTSGEHAGPVSAATGGADGRISSKADLKRLRAMSIDLEALAKQAKEE
jgi:hypothetical protein